MIKKCKSNFNVTLMQKVTLKLFLTYSIQRGGGGAKVPCWGAIAPLPSSGATPAHSLHSFVKYCFHILYILLIKDKIHIFIPLTPKGLSCVTRAREKKDLKLNCEFPRMCNRHQNNKKTIAKVLFPQTRTGERYLAVKNGSQNQISDMHFTYFPGSSLGKLYIKEPLAKKACTGSACLWFYSMVSLLTVISYPLLYICNKYHLFSNKYFQLTIIMSLA